MVTPYVDKIKLKDMIHNSMIQKMRNTKKSKLSFLSKSLGTVITDFFNRTIFDLKPMKIN